VIYNCLMKINRGLALILTFLLFACQPVTPPTVTIIDNNKVTALQTDERVPSALIPQAGLTLDPNDRILSNGLPIAFDQPITDNSITLQIRRAVDLTLVTPEGQKQIQSSAFTVGEVLQEAGIQLHASDSLDPPANTPITKPISGEYAEVFNINDTIAV